MVGQVAASSTLVNVAEDAELRLIRLLAESAPPGSLRPTFVQECESCIVNADASQLIKTVVNDPGAIGALFVLEPADEAISAFSLLTALLDRVQAPSNNSEQVKILTNKLADAVINVKLSASAKQVVERQISLLSVLYNMRPDVKDKCALLTKMIRLAGASKQPNQILDSEQPIGRLLYEDPSAAAASSNFIISPPAPLLISMLDAWDIPAEERRDLYSAIAEGVTDPSRKQQFLLLLLESYKDPQQIDNKCLKAAKEAALGAIKDPVSLFVHQRNMLSMPAVQALSKKESLLFGLLKVFQEGKLDDYNTYIKANGGEKKVLFGGVESKQCVRYMRILSLCSLAAEHEEIPYGVIKTTLLLESEQEVESWVIAAVSSGLLAAKMDQLQHKVMVERSIVRRFDIQQWKILQTRLTHWKKNVGNVIRGLKQSQQVSSAAGATGSTN